MSCRVSELVLNCHDPEALSQFWREALDYTELSRDGDIIEIGPGSGFGGPTPTIIFTPVSELKTVPLRLHIDINPGEEWIQVATRSLEVLTFDDLKPRLS